jgi:hypothetical protein
LQCCISRTEIGVGHHGRAEGAEQVRATLGGLPGPAGALRAPRGCTDMLLASRIVRSHNTAPARQWAGTGHAEVRGSRRMACNAPAPPPRSQGGLHPLPVCR